MAKNLFPRLLMLFAVLVILSAGQCPHDCSLIVTVGEGVEGTPSEGTYDYYENDIDVDYAYSLKDGYQDLKVTFDGSEISNEGTVNVWTMNHHLKAKATKIIPPLDIRGFWMGHQYSYGLDFELEVTFSGELNSGAATGMVGQSESNGTGTFTLSSDETTITFELVIPSQGRTFYFEGTMDGENKMSGSYHTNPEQWSGTWELHR